MSNNILKKFSRREIAYVILTTVAITGLVIIAGTFPGLTHILKLFKTKSSRERRSYSRSLGYLRSKKLISIKEENGNTIITITEMGKKRLLKYNFGKLHVKKREQWDGYWHLIVFDIPEKLRRARQAISHKLGEMDLYRLQDSVFISPYQCKEEIDFIGEYFGVRPYLRYFIVQSIDSDIRLRKHFHLSE